MEMVSPISEPHQSDTRYIQLIGAPEARRLSSAKSQRRLARNSSVGSRVISAPGLFLATIRQAGI
jgi:hypothetical protein